MVKESDEPDEPMENEPRPQEGDLEPGDDLPGEPLLPKPADDDERHAARREHMMRTLRMSLSTSRSLN